MDANLGETEAWMPTRAGFVLLRKLWAAYQEIPIRNPWQSEECDQPFSSVCQYVKVNKNNKIKNFDTIAKTQKICYNEPCVCVVRHRAYFDYER